MPHFVPCHVEIKVEEAIDLFLDNCYKLHVVPHVIVSDRDLRFVGNFWQSFMRKLNNKVNMSTARHSQTDGLAERVDETMQISLRCYRTNYEINISSWIGRIEPKHLMIETQIDVHNHPLVQATSTQGHHIQQNE